MPFSLNCTNRGCGKQMEPFIDPKDDKVYCSLCEKEINNVTYFAKVQMKTLKQFKIKKTISFAVKCSHCGKEDRPKLIGKEIVCKSCNKPIKNLTEPFKIMLREQLKTADKDI